MTLGDGMPSPQQGTGLTHRDEDAITLAWSRALTPGGQHSISPAQSRAHPHGCRHCHWTWSRSPTPGDVQQQQEVAMCHIGDRSEAGWVE